jgi:hypothetical protein
MSRDAMYIGMDLLVMESLVETQGSRYPGQPWGGPLRDFYVALLDKGMRPEMERLTLARKIAAITLTLWKKEERFDAEQLKPQAA